MRRLAIALLAVSTPAVADAPLAPKPAVWTQCAVGGGACVTVDRRSGDMTVTRARHGPMLWRVRATPAAAVVSRSGRYVAEEYREGGLVDLADGPGTLLLVLRDRGRIARRLTLGDVASHPADLPRTASHRRWSVVRYFDAGERLFIDLPDGRIMLLNGGTGQIAWQRPPADGRPAFCRYAEPDPDGPCATKRRSRPR